MSYRRAHDPTDFLARVEAVVAVTVVDAKGSVPRAVGASMLVSTTETFGTIGGGALEYDAITSARRLLAEGGDTQNFETPLGPEIGQCCGGRVVLRLERLNQAGRDAFAAGRRHALDQLPVVCIFGAGHVGAALARTLALSPVQVTLVDTRREALSTPIEGVASNLTAIPEAEICNAPPNAAYVIATHDHALDFLVTAEALDRNDGRYVGLIGSKTKRRRFENWVRQERPATTKSLNRLTCPIGAVQLGDPTIPADIAKQPEVIAAAVSVEVIAALYATAPPT